MVVAYGCRKTKKLICGMEGKHVVTYGRLPSPAQCVCVGSRLWVLMNARFDNIRIEEDSSIFIIVPYSQYIQYILYIYWNISSKYSYLSLSLPSCKLSFMSLFLNLVFIWFQFWCNNKRSSPPPSLMEIFNIGQY